MVGTAGVGASAFLMGLNLCLFESEGAFHLENPAKYHFTR
jgi:hypothetical protein